MAHTGPQDAQLHRQVQRQRVREATTNEMNMQALVGKPLHRMDARLSKDVNLPGGVRLTGIAEVFNLTNHKNFGAYNAQLNSTTFGEPRQNLLNAYQPRVVQLAFKFSF